MMKNTWKTLLLVLCLATLSVAAFAQTGYEGEGVPEFSTIGITAIIALAAGGFAGFKMGQKKVK